MSYEKIKYEKLTEKERVKFLGACSKLFKKTQEYDKTAEHKPLIMTEDDVTAIEFKNKGLEQLFYSVYGEQTTARKPQEIDYNKEDKTGVIANSGYMLKWLKVIETLSETVKVYASGNKPVMLETDYFNVWVAPRLEE